MLAPVAHAAGTPLAVSIFPPLQFPPNDFTIAGARVSALWGSHRNVFGFDVGVLGNITEQGLVGVSASGLVNMNRGQTTVVLLQAAGIANINHGSTGIYGLQVALVNSNTAETTLLGVQAAVANLSHHTKSMGLQVGVYNRAHTAYGFQVGVVNVAEQLRGIQIGLLNFNRTGAISVSPVINIGF
jgi:hypothetical protein